MEQIKIGDIVSVIYKASLDNGDVFDSCDNTNPLIFKVGENRLLQKFEDAVIGMKKGENKKLHIKSVDAYGEYDESLILDVDKSFFPEGLEPEIGLPIQLRMTNGSYGIGIIKDIKDRTVIIDANHPLAGKNLNFDLTVVGINDISQEDFDNMFNNSCSCEDESCDCAEDCNR